jgi:hypothetical protein
MIVWWHLLPGTQENVWESYFEWVFKVFMLFTLGKNHKNLLPFCPPMAT